MADEEVEETAAEEQEQEQDQDQQETPTWDGMGIDASASGWPAGMGNVMSPTWFSPMLPSWNAEDESEEHQAAILGFRTEPCLDFQRGHCPRYGGKGKGSRCSRYHFESQSRRCPVDPITGQILYWEVPCEVWSPEMNFCPNGAACPFAHGRDEVSYHPAKYKTRACNGHECRGEGVCCFAHSEPELRHWAPERYSYFAVASPGMWGMDQAQGGGAGVGGADRQQNYLCTPYQGTGRGNPQKHRFCATFPNVSLCRRGAACAFAHSRDEIRTPLLSKAEEEQTSSALTEEFFTQKFKTLWCPIGAQHDWQACAYAHTYQDARRKPSIGYGPQPCPYWGKKDTRAAYSQRCPLGLRCPYSHGAKEQLYHPNYFRTVICRDLQMRGCPRQHLCAFHHRRSERRSPGVDQLDYSKPLDKEAIPPDWAASFLAPPFFQETGESEEAMQRNAAAAAVAFPMMGPSCGGMFYPSHFGGMGCGGGPHHISMKERKDEETPRTQSTVFDGDALGAIADSSATSSRDDAGASAQQRLEQQGSALPATVSTWGMGGKRDASSSYCGDADSMAWQGGGNNPCFVQPCYAGQPVFFCNGPAGPGMGMGMAIPVQAVWWPSDQQQGAES